MKKRVWACALAAMMVLAGTSTALAQEDLLIEPYDEPIIEPYEEPIADTYEYTETFASFTGKVTAYEALTTGTDFLLFLQNEEGQEVTFVVNERTYATEDGGNPSLGEDITAHYRVPEINILIYPPRYTALALAPADQSLYVGRFDGDYVSSDNKLKLLNMETVDVIRQDGSAFEGELADVILAVTYDAATKSIPAQTNPTSVVVLDKARIASFNPIIVDGTALENAPVAMKTGDNKVLVPLRVIAEALGYQVGWDAVSKSVTLNNTVTLSIGRDYYTFARVAPIHLGKAPELIDGHTYVPLNFFTGVLGMNNAYDFEGEIVINDDEKME